MPKTEPDEKAMARVLRAFVEACDAGDYSGVYARRALHCSAPTREDRRTIKALREAKYLRFERGGQDEDGQFIGGTFYGPTNAGRAWLAEIDQQQELPL